ncbi:hypothetical protein pb186bvf_002758 [Paramecium bursaria]
MLIKNGIDEQYKYNFFILIVWGFYISGNIFALLLNEVPNLLNPILSQYFNFQQSF